MWFPFSPSARTATRPYGVIDIGSNSVRLVIFETLSRSPEQIFNEKVSSGLGRGMVRTGRLHEEGMQATLDGLARFRAIADHYRVVRLDVLATAAMRDAQNGEAFRRAVARVIGAPVKIISGQDEALISAGGVLSGIPDAEGVAGDLGGGSLEVARLASGLASDPATLPIGALRMADRFGDDAAAIRDHVREALSGIAWLKDCTGAALYTVGGIWRNFARVHMADTAYPLPVLHAYCMPAPQIRDLARRIAGERGSKPRALSMLPRRRTENIHAGAAVLDALVDWTGVSHVVISAYGLREGQVFNQLPRAERVRDPLVAAATRMAERMARTVLHWEELDPWMAGLFPPSTGDRYAPYWARLRHVASILCDIGWRFNPDTRAQDASALVLTTPLPGIDHQGRAYVALALWYRYTGIEAEVHAAQAGTLLDFDLQGEAKRLGRCLRLAFALTGGAPGLLPHCTVEQRDRTLRLTLTGPARALGGAEVQKHLERLADAYKLRPETVYADRL